MLAGDLAPEDAIQTIKDSGLKGMGGRRIPNRRQVGDRRQPGRRAKVRDLQRRRVRARHLQGSPDPGRAAAPRDRGNAGRDDRGRAPSRAGCSSDTSTAPRRPRSAPSSTPPRRRTARRRRARLRAPPRHRRVHLSRRLHPRRGVRADRVHGGPPRRAPQQAAVPRHQRALGKADTDELGRDASPRSRSSFSVAQSGGRTRASTAASA